MSLRTRELLSVWAAVAHMCLKVKVVPFILPLLMGMSKVPGPLRMSEPDSHSGSCPVTLSATGSGTSACDSDS